MEIYLDTSSEDEENPLTSSTNFQTYQELAPSKSQHEEQKKYNQLKSKVPEKPRPQICTDGKPNLKTAFRLKLLK